MQQPRWLRPVLVVVILLWLAQSIGVSVLVDWLWFDALGYVDVYARILLARVGLWTITFVAVGLFVGLNLRHAVRSAPLDLVRLDDLLAELRPGTRRLRGGVRLALGAGVLLPAVLVASVAASSWQDLLLFIGRQPFGSTDPVFGLDIGFFLFELPFLRALRAVLMTGLTMTLLPVAAWYIVRDVVVAGGGRPVLSEVGRRHALVLGALAVLLSGVGSVLDRYVLLSEQHGVVWGAGYSDVTTRIPGLAAVAALSVVVAVGLLVASRRQGWTLAGVLLVGFIVLRALLVGFVPQAVQDWYVGPNELDLERPYLERNIAGTRHAYALDRIEARPFEAAEDLTAEKLDANPLTVDNIRVWDDRPLLATYGQLQEIRLYYDFSDVDVDRYSIAGVPRQVMLSARELNANNLPSQARNWVNEHFQYTHGYGLTMSPVNVVTDEGLPELMIRDLPPALSDDLVKSGMTIDRPEIYYGELTDRYVFVRTGAEEFDYPSGDDNVYTTYAGKGGVPIGSLWRKALFAMHFGSVDILLSQYLTDESRVMLRRQVGTRVRKVAPFLSYDSDPYLVVADGRLFWVIDAYTTASLYPYSEPHGSGTSGNYNYLRNSVKAVVDAFNGSVDLYISDDSDPVIQAWSAALPGAFKDIADMPPYLRDHLRYPTGFFSVQASMYRAYHMIDPTVFYNKEDMWSLPRELYGGQDQPMEPYYLIMKLPGEDEAEFILLMPFAPTNRDNMISWLAARCDPEHYGKLILYQFPKQKLIYGPRQIESRIDQDATISQQITLWSQSGSRVVRGNLLVIPIEDSLLYVEPLYLQAETSQLPELKRVIVSYDNRIAMERTLSGALQRVFGSVATSRTDRQFGENSGSDRAVSGPDVSRDDVAWAGLAQRAQQELTAAVSLQRQGDWAGYGRQLDELGQTIDALVGAARLAPQDAASPDSDPQP
ncbi:MAG: UPF0182 family protein [Oligoflexia bacterium]|nr:UPF0182 family protein [Oligoflexia bacterium]